MYCHKNKGCLFLNGQLECGISARFGSGAGVVALWWSAFLACVRHWVKTLAPH